PGRGLRPTGCGIKWGMRLARTLWSRLARALLTLLIVGAAVVHLAAPAFAAPALVWERTLPAPAAIVQSSPAPLTLSDASSGIVFGARDGKVYAIRASDGSDAPGWPQQTANVIDSSPAAAHHDGSGKH